MKLQTALLSVTFLISSLFMPVFARPVETTIDGTDIQNSKDSSSNGATSQGNTRGNTINTGTGPIQINPLNLEYAQHAHDALPPKKLDGTGGNGPSGGNSTEYTYTFLDGVSNPVNVIVIVGDNSSDPTGPSQVIIGSIIINVPPVTGNSTQSACSGQVDAVVNAAREALTQYNGGGELTPSQEDILNQLESDMEANCTG